MAMDYDLLDIRNEFRKLTGRLNTNQLTDAECNDEINKFYQHILPFEINVNEYDVWTTFNTADGTGEYTPADTVLNIEKPVTVKDSDDNIYRLDLYTSPDLFKQTYPDDAHDEADKKNRPEAMLFYGRKMLLRPVPDAVYEIKHTGKSQVPAAFDTDDDTPADPQWWQFIAIGAAINFMGNQRETKVAKSLEGIYVFLKTLIDRKQIIQIPAGTRSVPRI